MYVFTWWCEVWSFVLQGPVNRFRPPHSDALVTQDIAHFLYLSNSFFQVVLRKRLAPILLIEGPILLICVSLLIVLKFENMVLITYFLLLYFGINLYCSLTFTSTVKGGTRAFSARPTITSWRVSHSLWLQTGHSCCAVSVTCSSSTACCVCAAAALEVLWEALCTHPFTVRPSWGVKTWSWVHAGVENRHASNTDFKTLYLHNNICVLVETQIITDKFSHFILVPEISSDISK